MSDFSFIEEPQTDSVYSSQHLIGRRCLTAAGHHVSRGVDFLHDGHHPGGPGGGAGGAAETQRNNSGDLGFFLDFSCLFCVMRLKLMTYHKDEPDK